MDNTDFVNELAKLSRGATFATLKAYKDESGSIADYSLVINIDYRAALKRSMATLEGLNFEVGSLEDTCKQELLQSFAHSLETTSEEKQNGAYQYFTDADKNPIRGVKLHKASQTLFLYGSINAKRITSSGKLYSNQDTRQSKTIVKDKLRSLTSVGRYRQFTIKASQLDSIRLNKITLYPPNE
jgi:hypothetical protein